MADLDVWTGTSTGVADHDDPNVVTLAWAVREGVELLGADIVPGGLLMVRLRVPQDRIEEYLSDPDEP